MIEKSRQLRPARSRRQRSTDTDFRAQVRLWADKIGVQPTGIYLRPMSRKWASCSSRGRLTFDTGLLRESRAFVDYVIVHELLHMRVPNHGKLFNSLLNAWIPDWQNISK